MTLIANILLVDDRPENLVALEAILEGPDRSFFLADSGNEALSMMLHHEFALIMLDVNMPEMSGFEVAELMRSNDKTREIPIIFVTAAERKNQQIFRGYESGAVDYLLKPLEPQIVRSKADIFLDLYRHQKTLEKEVMERLWAEESLEESQQQLQAILDMAKDAIITVDSKLSVMQFNGAAERMFMQPASRVIGKPLHNLLPERAHEAHEKHLEDFATGRFVHRPGSPPIKMTGVRQNGEEFDADVSISFSRVAGQRLFTAILREQKPGQDTSDNAASQQSPSSNDLPMHAAPSGDELEVFIRVASHDLQEPLRTIGSFLMLLEEEYGSALDDNAREYIKYAVDASKRTRDMLKALLDYSRTKLSRDEFKLVNMGGLVNEVKQDLGRLIDGTEAKVSVVGDLPTIKGDPTLLRQVLQNLIANGIKFCRRSPIVQVRARDDGDHFTFGVSDNGIGIEPRFFDRIFFVFQRLHNDDEFTGTGMGLAIVKKIIEQHGGQISVESLPEKGSRFSFTLPKLTS